MPCSLRYSERRFVGPRGGNGGDMRRDRVCTDQIEDVAIARLDGANNDRDEVTKTSIRPGLTRH